MKTNQFTCPVCGFGMDEPPSDFNICSSCGTEFGLHDENVSFAQLRAEWLRNGAQWWSRFLQPPQQWDPFMQVSALLEGGLLNNFSLLSSHQTSNRSTLTPVRDMGTVLEFPPAAPTQNTLGGFMANDTITRKPMQGDSSQRSAKTPFQAARTPLQDMALTA